MNIMQMYMGGLDYMATLFIQYNLWSNRINKVSFNEQKVGKGYLRIELVRALPSGFLCPS